MSRPKEQNQIRVRNQRNVPPIEGNENLTSIVVQILETPLSLPEKQALYRRMLENHEVKGAAAIAVCQALHDLGRDEDDPRTAYTWEG